MMTIDEYISNLRNKGIIVSVRDTSVKVKAPDGAITPCILKELKQRKLEILSFCNSIRKVSQFTKSIDKDKSNSFIPNVQLTKATYEEGQYDVLLLQKGRYLEYKSGMYNRMHTLIHEKLINVDEQVVYKAVDKMVSRHEILRTLFLDKEGAVLQEIYPANKFESNVSFVDISLSAQEKKEEKIRMMVHELDNHIFDFQKERAFKCKLIKYEKNEYYFIFIIDHMLYDVASIELIKEELFTLFDVYTKGIPNPLKPLKFQFKDYVNYNNQNYQGSKLEYHQSYFKNLFENIPPKLRIEPDKVFCKKELEDHSFNKLDASEMANSKGGTFVFTISEEISDQIQNFTSKFKISLFNLLIASYSVFLAKISNQNDFVIDSPISTRNNEDFSKIIGWLTGTLISRIKVNKDLTFREMLFYCREVVLEAMDHAHYQRIETLLDIKWDKLVSSQLNLINGFDTTEGEILDFEPYHVDNAHMPLDISFDVIVFKNGIQIRCAYNMEVISKSQILDVCNEYVSVVKRAISSPDIKIKHWDDV